MQLILIALEKDCHARKEIVQAVRMSISTAKARLHTLVSEGRIEEARISILKGLPARMASRKQNLQPLPDKLEILPSLPDILEILPGVPDIISDIIRAVLSTNALQKSIHQKQTITYLNRPGVVDALVVDGAFSEIDVGVNAFGIQYYRDGRLTGSRLEEKCWKSLKSKVLSEI